MRKFLLLATMSIMAVLAITSCNSYSNSIKDFGFTYELTSNGDADGHFAVAFDKGNFDIDGNADYLFKFTNDTTKLANLQAKPAVNLEEALLNEANEANAAALRTNEWLDNQLQITEYSGTYLLHIEGFVYEHLTGIKFEVNRTFTNRPVDNEPAEDVE